jgi:lysophospholipase L1-like esterase
MHILKYPWIKPIFLISVMINALLISNKLWELRGPKAFDTSRINYSFNRDKLYKILPVKASDVVFIGDSQIQKFDLTELLGNVNLVNRGIDGDVTMGVYKRLDDVIAGKPSKLFVEIGINDIRNFIPTDTSLKYTDKIIIKTETSSPQTKIFVIGLLPCSTIKSELVVNYNERLKQLCHKYNIPFIDSYSKLNAKGGLNANYDCGDGLHLNGMGYVTWSSILKPYLN